MPVRMKPSAHETPTDRPLTPFQLRLQQRQEFFPRSRQRKRPFLVAGLHGKHLQPTPFPGGQHRRTHASANHSAARRLRSRPPPDPPRPPGGRAPGKSAASKPVFQLPRVAAGARSPQDPDQNPLAPPRARASRRPPQPAPQSAHSRTKAFAHRWESSPGPRSSSGPSGFGVSQGMAGATNGGAGLPMTLPRSDRFLFSLTPPRSGTASRCRRLGHSP